MTTQSTYETIEPQRIEKNVKPFIISGLSMKCTTSNDLKNAQSLWLELGLYMGKINNQIDNISYGLCLEIDEGIGIEYLAGVEVSEDVDLPEGFITKRLPEFNYAVFEHQGHVSTIFQTCDSIWKEWIPKSEVTKPEGANFFFERYGEGFDPISGKGDIEIWVPVEL